MINLIVIVVLFFSSPEAVPDTGVVSEPNVARFDNSVRKGAPVTSDAVDEALAQALAGGKLIATEEMWAQVSKCWNVGSLSSAAMNTTVVVALNVSQDGKPDGGSIRMLSSSGGDDLAARQAFEAARRAILRCGGSGFDLPAEKYAHWREIEMTFNPERMRIK